MRFQFNPIKATQAGAYLLKRNDGNMDKYIWIKMLYLADRESMFKWEEPITGDSVASMQYGPVLSTIYDLTKGDCPTLREYWQKYISDADCEANRVSLKADPGIRDLSKAELAILDSIFEQFKNYSFGKMKAYIHNLPEYEEVGPGGSKLMPVEHLLHANGKSAEEIKEAEKRHRQMEVAEMLLAGS
jgi:uncharacterized phage-associated protein